MIDDVELRRLAEAATPGSWRVGQPITEGHITIAYVGTDCDRLTADGYNFEVRYPDAAYIAAMHPETTLALLDRLAELEADLMRHKEAIASMAFGEVPDDAATRRLTPFPGKPMVAVMSTPSPSSDDVE